MGATLGDDDLLPAQRQAVTHRSGPLLVIGAAGTGKTTIIRRRFGWLACEGCPVERIAVVAPSPARAEALRAGLEASLAGGYEQLFVLTPVELAAAVMREPEDTVAAVLGPGERLAMLAERVDELSLAHHDFGGNVNALIGRFVRRIDRLKSELIDPDAYAAWAAGLSDGEHGPLEREFAEVYRTHERMLSELGAGDVGDLVRRAIRMLRDQPGAARSFQHVLADDVQELTLAAARLVRAVAGAGLLAA